MLKVAILALIVSVPAGPCLAQTVQEIMNQAMKNPAVRDAMRGRIPSPGRAPSLGQIPDPNVMTVQRLLNERGFSAGRPDGIAGAGTRAAVSHFQRSIGRPATGELTQEELAILRSGNVPKAPSATKPTETVDIAEVQSLLTDLGYEPGPVDGAWGNRSQGALDDFRSSNGFERAGLPVANDVALLRELANPDRPNETESTPPAASAAGNQLLFALPIVDWKRPARVAWLGDDIPLALALVSVGSTDISGAVPVASFPAEIVPERPGLYDIVLVRTDNGEIAARRFLEVR